MFYFSHPLRHGSWHPVSEGRGIDLQKVMCNTFGRNMTWCADPKRDGFGWKCHRKSVAVCSESKSIKHASWFQHNNLTFQQVMFLTYDIVHCKPALPPVSKKSIASVYHDRGLGPVLQRDHARVHGGLLQEDRQS